MFSYNKKGGRTTLSYMERYTCPRWESTIAISKCGCYCSILRRRHYRECKVSQCEHCFVFSSSLSGSDLHGKLAKHNTGVEETQEESSKFRTARLTDPQRRYGEHYANSNAYVKGSTTRTWCQSCRGYLTVDPTPGQMHFPVVCQLHQDNARR